MKRDDCTLSPADLENVRRHADKLLREADAIGRLPTPVADLVAAGELEVARDVSLDQGFLGRLYRKVTRDSAAPSTRSSACSTGATGRSTSTRPFTRTRSPSPPARDRA